MERKNLEHLMKVKLKRDDIFCNLFILNKVGYRQNLDDINPFIAQLALLPVSKNSVFSDMLWDYDSETLNRAASVSLAKVQINFESYSHVPLGVITEIKCLFLSVYASPKEFGFKKNEIKPNTLIYAFKSGLNFLDFTFSEIERRLGKEYVEDQCSQLSAITLLDFEEAAKKTRLKLKTENKSSSYKIFFDYLNTQKAKEDIGIHCTADFNAIEKSYNEALDLSEEKEAGKLEYLETKEFEMALKKASFNVVSCLKALGETVQDTVMTKHYDMLATKFDKFPYSREDFDAYGAYRLSRKGYSFSHINSTFPDNQVAKIDHNIQPFNSSIEANFRKKFRSSEPLRLAINEAYYSALWIIGSLMAARPNVYSDLKINSCFDLKDNTIVSEEHKGRDNRWNLFNDRWIAIPIMIDAMRVIELIGGKVFQNTYVFSNVDTLKYGGVDRPMASLTHIVKKSFMVLTGLSPNDINSKLNGYVFRHSLSHQMFRADVGLPVISYQLKHMVSAVEALARKGKVSQTTLGYGGIANELTKGANKPLVLRHSAELEAVKANFDPNGKYMGGKAEEHLSKVKKFFSGCIEAGYTEEEIYEAMVEQGLAIINVGSGYCFGGVEDFDETLPCIGSLRCNPVRCHNAVVTKANAPKWREIYLDNIKLLGADGYEDRQDQLVEAIEESKRVLEYLGEALI
ncbi:hypothetical protein BCU00_007445 [Vibrio breoganii]|uniref:hypothetical protein n=1 Tax=Vibrio breoganii TaxID=553239 RepID=UPI000C85443F|nr:hypothetical protein [Vibrio breoganii]PMK15827.1 hypothetical protein BCU06_12970 [Vibrio breoganii]PMK43027.1 hypothetical protein BCU00_11465 [Vibrio breoganii]PMM18553.1 hypothetical protein BCT59_11825 [Vibrio breoganii]